MKRGDIVFHGGCVEGAQGSAGRCWFCGDEWNAENCCGEIPACTCMAAAQDWRGVSYKNVILLLAHYLSVPYRYFWEKWYS